MHKAPKTALVNRYRNGPLSLMMKHGISTMHTLMKGPGSSSQQIKQAIRTAPGNEVDLTDIELVWVYSDFDLTWGGIDESAITG
jgi:hypothetical protein